MGIPLRGIDYDALHYMVKKLQQTKMYMPPSHTKFRTVVFDKVLHTAEDKRMEISRCFCSNLHKLCMFLSPGGKARENQTSHSFLNAWQPHERRPA